MAEMLLWTNSRATSVLQGDFSVKSNLGSAKEFSQYLHMPTKSCCWLCCCCLHDQVLSSKSHSLSVISFNTCHQLTAGLIGRGEESSERALHRTHEAENALQKERRVNTFSWRFFTGFQGAGLLNSFLPYFFHSSFQQWHVLKLHKSLSQFYIPAEFHLLSMEPKNIQIKNGFSQRQVKSRLFGMTYYFDGAEHSKWRRGSVSCLSYRVLD